MTLLRKTLQELGAQDAKALNINKLLQNGLAMIGANMPITISSNPEAYVEKGFNYNAMLYSVVKYIAEKAADIPYVVERKNSDGGWDLVPDHLLLKKLDQPNPMEGGTEFRVNHFGFKLVVGNAYIYHLTTDSGPNAYKLIEASELWNMPAQFTSILSGGWKKAISGYKLQVGMQISDFLPEEIMHSRMMNLDYQFGQEFYGMSPIRALLNVLGKSNSAYLAQSAMYQNGGPAGIIVNKSATNPWTEIQQDNVYDRFKDKFAGASNKMKVMIANAEVGWQQIGLSPVDMQILQDQESSLRDFCRAYGIDAMVLGDPSASTYNNKKEATKAAYTDAIIPLVEAFASEATRKYLLPEDKNLRLRPDFSDVDALQADKEKQAQWLSNSPQMTPNEKREVQGLPKLDNPLLDEVWMPLGSTPLSQMGVSTLMDDEAMKRAQGGDHLK